MNYQRYQRDPREILSDRKTLLQAVTVLWENDHQELAQRLWDVGYQLKAKKIAAATKMNVRNVSNYLE